jgi:hydrogenase expression/formation protein HypE
VSRSEDDVLDAIERRRRRPTVKLLDRHVTLSHGAGGTSSHALIESVFVREFANPLLDPLGDAAVLRPAGAAGPRLAFTTDGSVVKPLFFPGGDIGELAVNGTVNDLAMEGARPLWLSAAFVLEEGLPMDDLRRIAHSMAEAAERAGVLIVAGDTKVVERGKADGLYIVTTGVGVIERDIDLSPAHAHPGDRILVSGPVGDHGIAIMVARGNLELETDLRSDTAPVHDLAAAMLDATPSVRWMRDPTRGGVATVLNELALAAELGVVLQEAALPVRDEVAGACEILGIDPLYVAGEGRLVAVVGPDGADAALAALRAHPLGAGAAIIGDVRAEPPGMVVLETAFGGTRVVDMLAGDPLPRIC